MQSNEMQSIQSNQCRFCLDEPGLHSFHISKQLDHHVCYHTCVREARDKKVSQIVEHIELYLTNKPEHMTWEWSMDCKDFKIEWYTFELTMELQRLVEKYHSTLFQFRLFNVNPFMRTFLEICRPFLSKKIRGVLKVE
jgi:hypothetical protein